MPDAPPPSYADRELSWLAFNGRVLQEAQDPRVPLFERLAFLAIFSSNLDEFFRVRVASLRHLLRLKKKKLHKKLDFEPEDLLRRIHAVVTAQQEQYGATFRDEIVPALAQLGLKLVDDRGVTPAEVEHLRSTFRQEVARHVRPVLVDRDGELPFLKNKGLYLVTELWERDGGITLSAFEARYVLTEIPSPPLPRFVTVPGDGDAVRVLFLDDVVRLCLPELLPAYDVGASYAVKLSRDADLYLDDEFSGNLKEMIEKALGKRSTGVPTRFLYDLHMPQGMLGFLTEHLGLEQEDLVEGGRYHNMNDLFGFPRCGKGPGHVYASRPPLPHPALEAASSIREVVGNKDLLLHVPYQAFDYVLQFLQEMAEDPDVEELLITLYRVAEDSAVAQTLIAAAGRGKQVTAFVEAKARFDEAANLAWARRMEDAGVRVIHSMPGLKVHSKLALAVRREGEACRKYAYLATGNFNEKTARVYTDLGLFTADPRLADDVQRVFDFLAGEDEAPRFDHLLVAPFTLRDALYDLVDREIAHHRAGRPAGITAKMNSLEDRAMIDRLYEASRAGVPVRLVVRGICCLVPGIPGLSPTVSATSIVDRFLEHARIYVFHNAGDEAIYLASADWMRRNLSRRVEVAFPVYDPEIRRVIRDLLELQLADNTKARMLDEAMRNTYVPTAGDPVRAQEATYRYFRERVSGSE